MNNFKLLIVMATSLVSCKTQTDSKKDSQSSIDVNSELTKRKWDTVIFYHNPQLDSIINMLIKNDTVATALGTSQENMPYLLCARTKAGYVEIHEQMEDIAIIRSGHGTLKTGHEVTGKIRPSGKEPWRNWFCDSIKTTNEQKVSPGDFIIIPAMTAHQYIPDPGDTLTYWTIKTRHLKNP